MRAEIKVLLAVFNTDFNGILYGSPDIVIVGPVATGGVADGATRQGVLACDGAVDPWIDDCQVGTL